MGVVLVTGAGGFVGSAVTRKLIEWMRTGGARFWDGEHVSGVCALLRPGSPAVRLETVAEAPGLFVRRADITDIGAFRALLDEVAPKAFVHLAFDPSGFGPETEAEWLARHYVPIRAAFEALASGGGRFVHTGSAWVLSSGNALDETAPLAPRLEYAKTKIRLDRVLAPLAAEFDVAWINLRLFNVFGRYEARNRLLPYLADALRKGVRPELSHGKQVRDFNDVDDVAEAYRFALSSPPETCGRIYHIGSGRGVRIRDFARMVCDAAGYEAEITFGATMTRDQDIPVLVSNPALASTQLGWRPNHELEDRIRAAVRWWYARPDLNEVAPR